MQILSTLRHRFEQALTDYVAEPNLHAQRVTPARDPRHGDYQANIAMPLKGELGIEPRKIAEQLIERVQLSDMFETPEVAGPGFINLKLKSDFLQSRINELAADERLLVGRVTPRKFVLDYSSPNVAKPMHVGHIRTTVIGDALAHVLRFLGHDVITDNHLGDWGTQFGMIIYGYRNFADLAAYEANPVAELSRVYRIVQAVIGYQSASKKVSAARQAVERAKEKARAIESGSLPPKDKAKELKSAEKEVRSAEEALGEIEQKLNVVANDAKLSDIAANHPDIEQRAQLETAKLHAGDADNLALWNQFLPISIQEIESVYERLNVSFDYTYGESFYHPMLADVVQRLVARGMAKESEGAICIFLDGFDAPMIIQKRDGAFLYATTDLATIEYRMEQWQPDAILYVVDHRQSEHFAKLFSAARAIGHTEVELRHISFGTVLGSDGKPFKTRSGNVLGLESLLDEAVEQAYRAVCNPERLQKAGLDMSDAEQKETASIIGLGAIKYADLSHNRTSDYEFNIEKMVQLEGNTSAYINYMYARTCSILKRSEESIGPETIADYPIVITLGPERDLALLLLQFEDALHQSLEDYLPNVLAAYLFSVAKQFATFFDQCPVLTAESDELKKSRLALCYATGRVLKQGLGLLGIQVVDRM